MRGSPDRVSNPAINAINAINPICTYHENEIKRWKVEIENRVGSAGGFDSGDGVDGGGLLSSILARFATVVFLKSPEPPADPEFEAEQQAEREAIQAVEDESGWPEERERILAGLESQLGCRLDVARRRPLPRSLPADGAPGVLLAGIESIDWNAPPLFAGSVRPCPKGCVAESFARVGGTHRCGKCNEVWR